MNPQEKKNFYVGLVVLLFFIGWGAAILFPRKSDNRKEYVVLSELPVPPEIKVGDIVMHGDNIVGSVHKVSPIKDNSKVAVRMLIKAEVFNIIGVDSRIRSEISPDGKTLLQLEIGKKGAPPRFIKIKVIKGEEKKQED